MTHLDRSFLERARATCLAAVLAGGRAALAFHRTGLVVETKADRSPVTAADRASEDAILEVVRQAFPEAAILAEESGAHDGSSAVRFLVDPLDGTRGFSRGGAFWGPLVGCELHGEIVAGAMMLPVLGRTYFAAKGLGALRVDAPAHTAARAGEDWRPLRVSGVSEWRDATLSLGELHKLFAGERRDAAIIELSTTCASTRCYGDLAGAALLLDGQAEAWIEAGVQVWDLAPIKILVEEAGGTFTDLDGRPTVESGHALATNGRVRDHVARVLADRRRGPVEAGS